MSAPTKLILRCGLSPGDIVMLTGAVRDLHRHYPGRFLTDVRTSARELWEHNPYITPLSEDDPECLQLDCGYPLINRANREPVHCLQGFVEFLNHRLGLNMRPTEFRGDIHLSPAERSWHSQVREQIGSDVPFWIVCAGGKFDVTIKWWSSERYQEVVNHFGGKILFVQVGQSGHWHPFLKNALDLRGQTSIRQMVRLMYHAEGVLCGVTFLMHLAAATPSPRYRPGERPCVVVAGGREPPNWEAYPSHQFIHTIGALPCCATAGCWKARVTPLYDNDPRDESKKLCVDVRENLPRCMDLITPQDVSKRVSLYYDGGVCQSLSAGEWKKAAQAIKATPRSRFESEGMSASAARVAIEHTVHALATQPPKMKGTGIVCCAGTRHFFHNALISLRHLRKYEPRLPVELWVGDSYSIPESNTEELERLNIRIIQTDSKHAPTMDWRLKAYALTHTQYRHVLLLDADSCAVSELDSLFKSPAYQSHGVMVWKDIVNMSDGDPSWKWFGLNADDHPLLDSGQLVIDRERHWKCVEFIRWLAIHGAFFDAYLGGSGCFSFALWKTIPNLTPEPAESTYSKGTLAHSAPSGIPRFEHRSGQRAYRTPSNFTVPIRTQGPPDEPMISNGFVLHHPLDQATQRRNHLAAASRQWVSQSDRWQLCPIDYDNLPRLFRDGGRRLPYVKDVISLMLEEAPAESLLVLTNTDVCLSPQAPKQIRETLKSTEACYSARRDFDRLDRLLTKNEVQQGERFNGVDLVAFTQEWWREQVEHFPDLLLGTEAWDWCFRVLIQTNARNHGRGFDNLVYHEKHESFWFRNGNVKTLASQQWNRSLAKPFLQKLGQWPSQNPW